MASLQDLIMPLPRPLRRVLYRAGYYLENRAHPGTDVYIISYPKTGRTWLRVLIGRAIAGWAGLPESLLLNTPRLTAAAGLPVTRFTHDDASLNAAQHFSTLEARKGRFRRQKVIYLARDPRDTMVSCYFQATRRIHQFDGPIADFIRDDRLGIRKYVRFTRIWYDNRDVPRAFLPLHYEDVHADAAAATRAVLGFIGVPDIAPEIVTQAVEYASFSSMRRLESDGQFRESRMKPGDASDPESYKVRKGIIGGYTEYLSADDLAFIESVAAEMGYPYPLRAGGAAG